MAEVWLVFTLLHHVNLACLCIFSDQHATSLLSLQLHIFSCCLCHRDYSWQYKNFWIEIRLKMILQMTETSSKKLKLPQVMLGFLRNFHLTAWPCKQKLGCFLLPGTGTSSSKLPLRGWYVNFKLQQKITQSYMGLYKYIVYIFLSSLQSLSPSPVMGSWSSLRDSQ